MIKAKQLARDEEGAVLVWTGGTTVVSSQVSVASSPPPLTSTPTERKKGRRTRGQEAKREKGGKNKRIAKDSKLQTPDSELISAERRHLTVTFSALLASPPLSGLLDPKDLRLEVC